MPSHSATIDKSVEYPDGCTKRNNHRSVILAAAYDADATLLMAAAVLAHAASVRLKRTSIEKLYGIAFNGVAATAADITAVNKFAGILLDFEEMH